MSSSFFLLAGTYFPKLEKGHPIHPIHVTSCSLWSEKNQNLFPGIEITTKNKGDETVSITIPNQKEEDEDAVVLVHLIFEISTLSRRITGTLEVSSSISVTMPLLLFL